MFTPREGAVDAYRPHLHRRHRLAGTETTVIRRSVRELVLNLWKLSQVVDMIEHMFDTATRPDWLEVPSDIWWPETATTETSDTDVIGIPDGLEYMAPGPELAAVLAGIDVESLSGYDMVVVLRAQQRMLAHTNAQLYRTMTAIAGHMETDETYDGDYMGAMEAAAAEIRVALRLTRRATDHELSFAVEVTRRLPQVWDALNDGTIDVRRARTIAHHPSHRTTPPKQSPTQSSETPGVSPRVNSPPASRSYASQPTPKPLPTGTASPTTSGASQRNRPLKAPATSSDSG